MKTVIEMAREAGWMHEHDSETGFVAEAAIKFAALVAADEREQMAQMADKMTWADNFGIASAIRARGQK